MSREGIRHRSRRTLRIKEPAVHGFEEGERRVGVSRTTSEREKDRGRATMIGTRRGDRVHHKGSSEREEMMREGGRNLLEQTQGF